MLETVIDDPVVGLYLLLPFAFAAVCAWGIIDEITVRHRCCWKCKRRFMEERNERLRDWKNRHPGEPLPESLRFDGWFQDAVTHEYVFTDEDRNETDSPDASE